MQMVFIDILPGVGFDNSVYKVVPLTDNKRWLLEAFTRFNGVNSPRRGY
jgi:hypothetical protein